MNTDTIAELLEACSAYIGDRIADGWNAEDALYRWLDLLAAVAA